MKLNHEDLQALELAVNQGYVRKSQHPSLPLTIYNYTPKTQFESFWIPITTMCRGLVIDDKGNIVIKCPQKFFNVGENFAAPVQLDNSRITEKLDGYYISIKLDTDWGLIVTSRGSFNNKYTEAAKSFIDDITLLQLAQNHTYFCELLQNFPEDEGIILTKHPDPKLVCWAIKDENHNELIPDDECPFPLAKELSLAEAKQYLEQKVEGIVAQDLNTHERVKLKTEWFIEHHRILSDCTKHRAWEILSSGRKIEDMDIPDEFMPRMQQYEQELLQDYDNYWQKIGDIQYKTSHLTDKELGLLDNYQEFKPYLFLLRKDRWQEALRKIWNKIEPRNML